MTRKEVRVCLVSHGVWERILCLDNALYVNTRYHLRPDLIYDRKERRHRQLTTNSISGLNLGLCRRVVLEMWGEERK